MGQYFKPAFIGARGGVRWLYSRDYGSGMKLMEHSYLGNSFVNAALSQILHTPMRMAWIGDYSDDVTQGKWGDEPYQKIDQQKFKEIFGKIWVQAEQDHVVDKRKIRPEPLSMFQGVDDFIGWYLVNHSQKKYIDLASYTQKNKWRESYKDWLTGETETWDMCVNPLPLLTACGNNRGGGDYYDCHPDFDQVGTWAFDLIEFTAFKPEGYEEVHYSFTEHSSAQ